MSVPNDHILELTIEFQRQEQDGVNVYFYQNLGLGAGILDILDGWWDTFAGAILGQSNSNQEVVRLRGRDIFTPGSSVSQSIGEIGTNPIGGNFMPPFNAISYDLFNDNPLVRQGSKRIGYMSEDMTDNGLVNSPAFQSAVDVMVTMLLSSFTDSAGDGSLLTPVVLKRVEDPPTEYRLPISLPEAIVTGIGVVEGAQGGLVTSQNSRKTAQ